MADTKIKNISIHAGLFRRFLAFTVDYLLLGIFGFILSIPFSQFFYMLGYNGWWIGFIITLIYFSFMQSKLSGQTFGASLLKIAVVNNKGKYLTFKHALLRNFLLLLVPYNSAYGPYISDEGVYMILLGTIFFSYLVAFFIYILFHPQRRGLHDLASGAYVVNLKKYNALTKLRKQKYFKTKVSISKLVKITQVTFVLIAIALTLVNFYNPAKDSFVNEINLAKEIKKNVAIKQAGVVINYLSYENKTTKTLIITVSVDRDTFTDENKLKILHEQIIEQVKTNYPDKNKVDKVRIVFNSGYSNGLSTLNENISTPAIPTDLIK